MQLPGNKLQALEELLCSVDSMAGKCGLFVLGGTSNL